MSGYNPDYDLTYQLIKDTFGSLLQVGPQGEFYNGLGNPVDIIGPSSQGPQGVQGNSGIDGTQGPEGLQGPQGNSGIDGTQGPQGNSGIDGIDGTQGPEGLQGLQGINGTQGLQGPQGIQGPQGLQGLQGAQGLQGLQGITGTQGFQGAQGLQGLQGFQGTQGLQGLQGPQGLQGLQGITGTQGPAGITGAAFSPMNVSACDLAPTAATTQYYYQTIAELTMTVSKAKLWGFSGSDTVRFGLYRGTLSGSKTLIGQGSALCGIGPNVIDIIAQSGQTLDLVAGEDIIVGFYPAGTSWRTVYDTGISDTAFGITNTADITTMPANPTGTATGVRFALTLY